MSFGNVIFMALLFVLFVIGTTGTPCDYAQYAVYSPTHLAQIRQYNYELALRSTEPELFCDRMQSFNYSFTGSHWDKRIISWDILQYSPFITKESTDAVIAAAFDVWSEVISFTFVKKLNNEWPDLRIRFVSGLWPPSVLGRTMYSPQQLDQTGGIIVFNNYTNWVDKNRSDHRNLRLVAVHEIGHALGLDHSENPDAVMYYTHDHRIMTENFTLHSDDIVAIQKLYGPPDGQPLFEPPAPTQAPNFEPPLETPWKNPTPPPTYNPPPPTYYPPPPSYYPPPPSYYPPPPRQPRQPPPSRYPSPPQQPRHSPPPDPSISPMPPLDPKDETEVLFGPVVNNKGELIVYMRVNGHCGPYLIDPNTRTPIPYFQ